MLCFEIAALCRSTTPRKDRREELTLADRDLADIKTALPDGNAFAHGEGLARRGYRIAALKSDVGFFCAGSKSESARHQSCSLSAMAA